MTTEIGSNIDRKVKAKDCIESRKAKSFVVMVVRIEDRVDIAPRP